ncbi:TPA: hypothetical protein ACOBUB_002150 [Enterococcus faecium]
MTVEDSIKHITTRRKLYDEIWEISAAGTARKYNIPYQQFLTQVKEASIPVPPSGYWAKLSSGKSVSIVQLEGNPDEQVLLSEKVRKSMQQNKSFAESDVKEKAEEIEEVDSDISTVTIGNQEYNYYNRIQLYNEIWKKTITDVAKQYQVSDTTIHKVCKSLDVPTPPPGYWSKIRSGSKVTKTPLPKGNYPSGKIGMRNKQWIAPEKGISIEERLSFLDDEKLSIILSIADQIELPDENEKFHSSVIKQRKKITNWQKAYTKNLNKGLGKYDLDTAPMNADNLSEEGVARSCRILDVLIKTLEPLGCQLLVDQPCFIIDGENVSFSFSEAKDKVPHVLTSKENMELLKYEEEKKHSSWAYKPKIRKYDYPFNGKLSFKLITNKFFRDCKSYQLEDKLGEMVLELYEASEFVKQKRIEREEEERKKEEERRLREEQKERYNKEIDRTDCLLNEALDFEKAVRIRNFITAAEKSGNHEKYSVEWIAWAKKKADWFDPTIADEDKYFGVRDHSKDEQRKKLEKNSSYWYW